jgi:hypothetical protein
MPLSSRSKTIADELLKALDTSVDNLTDTQFKQLISMSEKVLATYYDTLQRDKDGNITEAENTDWVKGLLEVEQKLLKLLTTPNYNKGINQYFSDFDTILQLNKELQTTQNGIVDYDKLEKALSPKQTFIKDKVLFELKQGGIKKVFVEPTKQVLLNAISLGWSIEETRKEMDRIYTPNGELERNAIRSYMQQIARDAIYSYNGTINATIAQEYDLGKYSYIGGTVSDTRPFCQKYHGTIIAKKDLNEILTVYLGSPTLSQGMFKVPVSDYEANFAIYRGGWNCRHIAIPLR